MPPALTPLSPPLSPPQVASECLNAIGWTDAPDDLSAAKPAVGRALAALCREAPHANLAAAGGALGGDLTAGVAEALVGLLAAAAGACQGQAGERAGSACDGASSVGAGAGGTAGMGDVLEAVLAAVADLAGTDEAARGQVGPESMESSLGVLC
jgi:hypothetical protein